MSSTIPSEDKKPLLDSEMEPEVSVNNNEELPPYSDNEKHLLLSDNEKCDLEEVPTSYRVTRHSNKFKRFCQILSLFGVLSSECSLELVYDSR